MELEQIRGWAREAGSIALRHLNHVEVQRKPDRSFVTAADIEIERVLRTRITEAYPDHGILGEEGRSTQLDAEYVWVLDPIDGTGSYVSGLPNWAVSIGLLRGGVPVLGTIYMPQVDEWYEAGLTGPALFNGMPIEAARDDLLDSEAWISVPSDIHRRYRIDYPGKIKALGSIAASICYVARGVAVGSLLGWPKLWDIAAGWVILERAGGAARLLRSFEPVNLEQMMGGAYPPEPVIIGSPPALAMLHERIELLPK